MVDVKPYTLPPGLLNALDPSSAEVAYIQGIGRAGVPAGLLQSGLNDAKRAREETIARLFDEIGGMNARNAQLNDNVLRSQMVKDAIGAVVDLGKADNPSMPGVLELPMTLLREQGVVQTPLFDKLLAGSDLATVTRDRKDQSIILENTGRGVRELAEGGWRPSVPNVQRPGQLSNVPYDKTDPTSIARTKIEQEGLTDRATKPRYEINMTDVGSIGGAKVVGPTPEETYRGATRMQRNLQGQGAAPPTAPAPTAGQPGTPDTPAPSPQQQQESNQQDDYTGPIGRGVRQKLMTEMSGSTEGRTAYGGHFVYPSMAEQMREVDIRPGWKPSGDFSRGWGQTPEGIVRDFIGPDGKRRRVYVFPLPGGGAETVVQREG